MESNESRKYFIEIACKKYKANDCISIRKATDFVNICLHEAGLPIGPQLIRDWFNYGSDGDGFQGDIILFEYTIGIISKDNDGLFVLLYEPDGNIVELDSLTIDHFLGFRSII